METERTQTAQVMSVDEVVERIRKGGNFLVSEQEEGNQDTYLVAAQGSPDICGIVTRPFANASATLTIDYRTIFNHGLTAGYGLLLRREQLRTHALTNGVIPQEHYPTGSRGRYITRLRDEAGALNRLVKELVE